MNPHPAAQVFDPVRTALRIALLTTAAAALLTAPAAAQKWRTIESARQLWDREPVSVEIRYGAGELHVGPADSPLLYSMEMRYDEDHFRPITEFDADHHRLTLGVESRDSRNINVKEGSTATIALTREVPLDLDLEFGAGEANLEIGAMSLRSVKLSTGASETHVRFAEPNRIAADRVAIDAGAAELEVSGLGNARASEFAFQGGVGSTTLDFTGSWSRDADATVKMGLGAVTLRFPRGLGVRLVKSSFLTSFDSEGLIKRGDAYYSPDWDSAARKLTISVDAAFGSIGVEWVG